MDVILNADKDKVYAVVTDYEHLNRISEVLVESALLSEPGAVPKRRKLVIESCVVVFCFKIDMVEDVEEIGNEKIIATIVPELSDIKYGKTEWLVTATEDGRSRIRFHGEEEPGFWIPPVIGPILMKRKMLSEVKETIEQIERLAND